MRQFVACLSLVVVFLLGACVKGTHKIDWEKVHHIAAETINDACTLDGAFDPDEARKLLVSKGCAVLKDADNQVWGAK